ncbi:hypothetical protein TNCV_4558941 [Trichonephila clavipes]|nr:hypothetical protein TNCV_4558941 [Trichonephila clavipes]
MAKTALKKDNVLGQGSSYRRINDMGPPSYRGPNMCNYSTTNKVFFLKKRPPKPVLIRDPLRTSYVIYVVARQPRVGLGLLKEPFPGQPSSS